MTRSRHRAPLPALGALLALLLTGCNVFLVPRLEVSPQLLEYPAATVVRTFVVRNAGPDGSLLRWRFDGPARLTAVPESGTLRGGESAAVELWIDRSGLVSTALLTASVTAQRGAVELVVVVDPLVPSGPAPCDVDPQARDAFVEALPVDAAAALLAAVGIEPTAVLVRWHQPVAAEAFVGTRGVAAGVLPAAAEALVTDARPFHGGARLSGPDPLGLARSLEADPRVRWVELDGPLVRPSGNGPDDPAYLGGDQWWLDAFGFAEGRVPAGELRALDVIVAVIDTGLRPTHEDLADAIVPGRSFVRYAAGTQSSTDVADADGHGSHVAGLVAAVEGNGVGILGLAAHAGVRVQPVKVFGDDGHATIADLVAALRWVAGLAPSPDDAATPPNPVRVDVVNLSLGSPLPSAELRKAVIDVRCEDILLVGAAGNGVANVGQNGGVDYPAAYPEVISIGSVDEDMRRSTFSDYGEGLVDLMAPGGRRTSPGACGVGLLSTFWRTDSDYACLAGTSMATPIVAASAATLMARDPDAYRGNPAAIEAALRAAAARNPGPNSAEYGFGVLCLDALTTTSVCGLPAP